MLIDSHAHLEMKEFDSDRPDVIDRARLAGVDGIITVGTNLRLSRRALSIARQYENVYASVGIHPHDVGKADKKTFDELKLLAEDPKVVAYGEIGLDYFRNISPREKQTEMFGYQLALALELKLPVIIHDRDAHEETLRMVKASGVRQGVFHCFSGNLDQAEKIIEMGFYLGIGGVITFKNSGLDKVIDELTLDRIILETDAPFLAPVPFRGKRNESAYLKIVAEKIAELKSLSLESVAEITSANAAHLFNL